MESSEAAAAFAALSVGTRRNLLRLLMAQGASGLPAGDIAARLALPASTTSFHLAALLGRGAQDFLKHPLGFGEVSGLMGRNRHL
jgi:DNA-binding transcriptional ArsR family regulator